MYLSWSRFFILSCLLFALSSRVKCAKILGVFPVFGMSHHKLAVTLMRGLADAGNDVTIVCSYEDKYTPKKGSYKTIILEGFAESFEEEIKDFNLFELQDFNYILQEKIFEDHMYPNTEKVLTDPGIQKLIKDKETFDAVIIEQFSNEALKVLPHIFKSHLIVYNSFGPFNFVNRLVATPTMVQYTPQLTSTFTRPMSFVHRLYNTILYTAEELMNQYLFLPKQDKLIQKHFPGAPSIYELTQNVSLLLVNSHETMWQAIPLAPNVVSIGGFYVPPKKKLPPDDIQKYLDTAKDGAIFFSFGSNLKSTDLPKEKMDAFLNTFRKLKQKVLWKLEGEVENLPPNVKTGKWLPQMDILAHPNVQLFITHAGLLSMTETIYNGVPVLAIPVYGDQATNANNAVFAGCGLSIVYHELTEEKFNKALKEVLTEPKYKLNAIKRSKAFHDRPIKPLDAAVYWVEYVIKHGGAPHLRVDGLQMPWYQYLLLDVIAVLSAVFITIVIILTCVLKLLFGSKSRNIKVKKS